MSRSNERDEQEALKLDEHFKETLARVRPYIIGLNSPEDAQLCRMWLEKLNFASTQRNLRNEYLVELYRQLKAGHIDGIFSKSPPNGLLIPLPRPYHLVCLSSSVSDLSDSAIISCPKHSMTKYVRRNRSQEKAPFRRWSGGSVNAHQYSQVVKVSPTDCFYDESRIETNQLQIYKHRIDTLTMAVEELQMKNERLTRELRKSHDGNNVNETTCFHTDIKRLNAENALLKSKLAEAQKMKDMTEMNHKQILQLYKNTVMEQFTKLKVRLNEAQSENQALDMNLKSVTEKLEELVKEKEETINEMETEWTNKMQTLRQQYKTLLETKEKELQAAQELNEKKNLEISQKDSDMRQEIEKYTRKINDLEADMKKRSIDEVKLQTMFIDQCSVMKEEFNKIRSETDYNAHRQMQSLTEKIAKLKIMNEKLERRNEKLKDDYEKKIFRIIKNKNLEIQALQLQLQGQRSELSTSLNSKKQSELDYRVRLLEEKYKALLAAADATVENERQEYLSKVAIIEEYLCNIKKCLESESCT